MEPIVFIETRKGAHFMPTSPQLLPSISCDYADLSLNQHSRLRPQFPDLVGCLKVVYSNRNEQQHYEPTSQQLTSHNNCR